MLTYITMTIENEPYLAGIKLTSKSILNPTGSVDAIAIYKKSDKNSLYEEVYRKSISTKSDLDFVLLDTVTRCRENYSYIVRLYKGNNIVEFNLFPVVTCEFEGLFVGNFDKQYVAYSNFKTEYKKNTQVEYVTTLSGKYPYRVSNAETNYCTGTSSGLFLELTSNKKKFVPDDYHIRATEVLEFLADGTSKILKTHDGLMWYVSIDAEFSEEYNDRYTGYNMITFSWTEIDELPTTGLAVLA